jgi:hypothetical protein
VHDIGSTAGSRDQYLDTYIFVIHLGLSKISHFLKCKSYWPFHASLSSKAFAHSSFIQAQNPRFARRSRTHQVATTPRHHTFADTQIECRVHHILSSFRTDPGCTPAKKGVKTEKKAIKVKIRLYLKVQSRMERSC